MKGFRIESRMPIIDTDWETCKIHGHTPDEGFTQIEATRIASSIIKLLDTAGPEIQIRVVDPNRKELARESTRR